MNMGASIGIGMALVVIGAVLAFAVDTSPPGLDLNLIGWILMGVGAAGAVIGALAAASRGPMAVDEPIIRR